MSYCVHCGVELDESCSRCPLCNTVVIDPNKYEVKDFIPKAEAPFPLVREEVEKTKKTDLVILITVILVATSLTSFILNIFLYRESWWSFYLIGICAVLWLYIFPPIIRKMPVYIYLLMDYASITLFLLLISIMHPNKVAWFFPVAVPIITMCFVLVCILVFLTKRKKPSFLSTALYIFTSIGIECATIEITLDLYSKRHISLTWSAIVIAVVVIINIALTTILTKSNLRKQFQKKFHF